MSKAADARAKRRTAFDGEVWLKCPACSYVWRAAVIDYRLTAWRGINPVMVANESGCNRCNTDQPMQLADAPRGAHRSGR